MKASIDLKAVVRHYKQTFRPRAAAELASFEAEETLEAAVGRAALAQEPDGTRYGHQRRRTAEELRRGTKKLLSCLPKLAAASNFGQLFEAVDAAVGHLDGLGDLYVYDTALRIGAQKKVFPARVYLHAGTRAGAIALLGKDAKDLKVIFKFELPKELHELEAHEIEDVLCIYKRYFTGEVTQLDENKSCWIDEDEQAAAVRQVGC
ncbi:MAG: hypothetical protein NT062_36405 [Proteobacteria bacterium]|nr:hypothetical protein [Pseudomonadota bacterium]